MPRLRRSDPSQSGITRHRRGRGFSYTWSRNGRRVEDQEVLQRIDALAIPPAWTDVWSRSGERLRDTAEQAVLASLADSSVAAA